LIENLDQEWIEGWLEFQSREVVATNLDRGLADALGRELVGLASVLKMHGLPFRSMEWKFRSQRVLIHQRDETLLLLLIRPGCGLTTEEMGAQLEEL
jgi:hypothetical protein